MIPIIFFDELKKGMIIQFNYGPPMKVINIDMIKQGEEPFQAKLLLEDINTKERIQVMVPLIKSIRYITLKQALEYQNKHNILKILQKMKNQFNKVKIFYKNQNIGTIDMKDLKPKVDKNGETK